MPTEAVNVRAIFDRALEMSTGAERAAYLDRACAELPEVRQEVEALLNAHSDAGSFLQSPAAALEATRFQNGENRLIGTQIGPYKLLQEIGEGGMGIVYMAQQERPVQRTVALKIIKPGMDSAQVIARFEAERQALALMDHPNIAKVLDASTTENGRPYFVMELVKGISIIQYADEHRLTPRQRLELFIPVCQAVQHAHQKGIIHRDIKPTNVLVAEYDDRPVPKVIDFGVAKAIGQHLTEKTMFTQLGQVVGTIEYMSPEQAKLNQLDIDTRTDVYSLGVLLYELLAGETPFDRTRLRSAAFDEMLRIIREEEPPKPSTRLSSSESLPSIAAQRHLEPKKLTTLVAGELDWIVMKSLEKDRNRRYETANGFALDVERYLAGEPVLAVPPSIGYRLRKFVRKQRGPVIGAVLVLLSIIGGAIGTVYGVIESGKQRTAALERQIEDEQRASEAAARRSRTAASVATALDDARARTGEAWALADEPHKMRTVTDLALAAVRRAEGFAGAGEAPEQSLVELATVRVAAADLERHTQLFVAADEILQDRDVLREGKAGKERTADRLAAAFKAFGWDPIQAPPDTIAAEISASRVRNKLLGFFCEWEDTVQYADRTAEEQIQKVIRAVRLQAGGNLADWQRMKDEHDLVGLGALAARPEALDLGPELLCALSRDLRYYGRHEEAVLALLRRAADRYPAHVWVNDELSVACLGASPSGPLEAFRALAAAAAIRPDNVVLQRKVAQAYESFGKNDLAAAQYRKVIALSPTDSTAYRLLADMRSRAGDSDGAIAVWREYVGRVPDSALSHYYLGKALHEAKDLAGAADAFRETIRLKPEYAAAHDYLGNMLRDRGDLDGAIVAHKEAVRLTRLDWRNVTNAHENLWADLVEKNAKLGKTGDAASLAAFAEMTRFEPKDPWPHVKLGTLLWDRGDSKGAIARYRDALQINPVPNDPDHDQALHSLGGALLAEQDYAGALAPYRELVHRWPKDDSVHSGLAAVLAQARDWAGAIAEYTEAVRIKPYDAAAQVGLARVLAAGPDGVRDGKKAVEHATQACELDYWKEPRHISILAAAYAEVGDFDKAVEYQKKALTFPEYERQYGARMRERLDLYAHQKPYRETDWGFDMAAPPGAAVLKYWWAVRRDPNDATAHLNLANAFRRRGQLAEAEQHYSEALRIRKQRAAEFPKKQDYQQDLANSLCQHGDLLRDMQRFAEALPEYEQALSIQRQLVAEVSDNSDLQNELARTCRILSTFHRHDGDWDGAMQLLIEAEPHHLAALKADARQPIYRQYYRDYLRELIKVHAGLLEQADAVHAAETCRDLGWDAGLDAYDAACYLSVCVPVVAKHDKLDEQQRTESAQFYRDAAMKILRDAVGKGYKNVAHMRRDSDLDPLRNGADFRKLIAELDATGETASDAIASQPADPDMPTGDEKAVSSDAISASDVDRLRTMIGKEVIVEGRVVRSAWSSTGKSMPIIFADAKGGASGLVAVIFQAERDAFDKAFAGDAAKAFSGARLRITGRVEDYGGRDAKLKGLPEIKLSDPSQVTILK